MANTIFWILVVVIAVALVIYLIGRRKKPKGPEESPIGGPSETPPTEGPEV